MPKPVLVTYAGRTGSTAGVAQAIGDTLCNLGVEIDVRPMQYVQTLANYSAVVAGSAIQGGRWLPEAMQFLEQERRT
jgi:menaquinone-dependent protoporphyrinogen oxidase